MAQKIKLVLAIIVPVLFILTAMIFSYMSNKYARDYWFVNNSYEQGKMIRMISVYKNLRNMFLFLSLLVLVAIILW